MYSLWNFLLTRSAFTKLLIVALVVSGVYALMAMPKESNTEIKIPIGIVTTVLPGATAADIERLITDELEPAVRNVSNIEKVTSQSRAGVSIITAEFIASADIETSIQDLRNAIEGAKRDLPTDAESPTVTKVDFANQPVLMVAIGSDLHPAALTKLGEDLKDDLVNIPGISKVEVAGPRDREIALITNKDSLLQYGISPLQIVGAISAANASVPAGSLTIDDVSYPIQFKGDITNIEDIQNAPIQTQSGTIKVSDVAHVVDGFVEANTISRLSIPLSFTMAFIGMWMTGNTINFISLFALIIAIGVLVDSGIVVVEGIHTNKERGMSKLEATQKAISDFAWPLIAGTMTTVAVFLPLFFLSGILGQF